MKFQDSPIEGILFDLDGTLYDRKWLKYQFIPFHWRHLKLLSLLPRARAEMAGVEHKGHAEFHQHFYRVLSEKSGQPPEKAGRWYQEVFYPTFIRCLKRKTPRKGLIRLLEFLKQKNIRLGVVSDHSFIAERLKALHIPPGLFDLLLSCEEVGSLKPHPSAFLSAAKKLGLAPEKILFVGDRCETDGEGARRAGMPFALIASQRDPQENKWSWQEFRESLA